MVVPNEKILYFVFKKTLIRHFEKKNDCNCQKGGYLKPIAKAFSVQQRLSSIDRIGK